jgi:hypothetical protein
VPQYRGAFYAFSPRRWSAANRCIVFAASSISLASHMVAVDIRTTTKILAMLVSVGKLMIVTIHAPTRLTVLSVPFLRRRLACPFSNHSRWSSCLLTRVLRLCAACSYVTRLWSIAHALPLCRFANTHTAISPFCRSTVRRVGQIWPCIRQQ